MKKQSPHRQINLSCQGPITRNNNALELTEHFIPKGRVFFSQLFRYDWFLNEADDPSHSFGRIGKSYIYLLPFLKAFGANDERIEEYSTVHLTFRPGAKMFFEHIHKINTPCFLISAAYEPFVLSVCRLLDFQEKNSYYTPLNLDSYSINESEKEVLKDLADEITNMPPLALEKSRNLPGREVSAENITYGQRLEMIFTDEIAHMSIGKIFTEIMTMSGNEKIKSVIDSLNRTGNTADEVMYIGHSVMDAAALRWVKNNGGMAISFDGDREAVLASEIAVIGGNTITLAILGDAFGQNGRESVLDLIENWDLKNINNKQLSTYQPLISQLFSFELESFPRLELVTETNLKRLISESESFHQMIPGERTSLKE